MRSLPSNARARQVAGAYALVRVVGGQGGVEPPTFRFSGLRITVQGRPWQSRCLLSDMRWTPVDAGRRG